MRPAVRLRLAFAIVSARHDWLPQRVRLGFALAIFRSRRKAWIQNAQRDARCRPDFQYCQHNPSCRALAIAADPTREPTTRTIPNATVVSAEFVSTTGSRRNKPCCRRTELMESQTVLAADVAQRHKPEVC
jgi:hypothetical protein